MVHCQLNYSWHTGRSRAVKCNKGIFAISRPLPVVRVCFYSLFIDQLIHFWYFDDWKLDEVELSYTGRGEPHLTAGLFDQREMSSDAVSWRGKQNLVRCKQGW